MVKDLQYQWKTRLVPSLSVLPSGCGLPDSVQRIEGITEFIALCERLTRRCESLQMEILSIVQDANVILMNWIMTMSFNKYPSTPVYGSTKLIIHPDGRIICQRDYFDLWGDIFNGIPYFKKTYRKFMRKYFG